MIGNILGKRYQIVEKIATGGMSSVYKALDLNLKRYDVIKILKEEFEITMALMGTATVAEIQPGCVLNRIE